MSEAEFWASTPRYFFARCDAVQDKRVEEMERTRLLAWYIIKTVDVKDKYKTPQDLFPLPGESKIETMADMWAKIDPAALEKFNTGADKALEAHRTKRLSSGDNSRP